jgi:hypothetical protein
MTPVCQGTKLHFKSPTAERRHVLCVWAGIEPTPARSRRAGYARLNLSAMGGISIMIVKVSIDTSRPGRSPTSRFLSHGGVHRDSAVLYASVSWRERANLSFGLVNSTRKMRRQCLSQLTAQARGANLHPLQAQAAAAAPYRHPSLSTASPLGRLRHKPTVTSVTPQACRYVGYATSLPLRRLRHKRTGIQGYHSMNPCFTTPRRRPSTTEGYVLRPAVRPAT